jgi:hypothetical protein
MWSMALRIVAALLAIAVALSYVLPDGKLRTLSYVAIPVLIVAFIEIRRRAGKVPDPEDPPWNG